MKTLLTSLRIWLKTVVLNAVMFWIVALWQSDVSAGIVGFVSLVAGLFLTAPLLVIINPLIKASVKLPYSVAARITWLFFSLTILIMFFYLIVFALVGDHPFKIKGVLFFTGVTSVALLIAVLTTRKSLIKLNTQ